MKEICDLIEAARARGIQVSANQYPYTAGQNDLVALIPPWAMEGGREEMLMRLNQAELRKRMVADILKGLPGWYDHYTAMGDWSGCRIASVQKEKNRRFEGKSIAEVAQLTGKDPSDAVFDLLWDEGGSVPAVIFL